MLFSCVLYHLNQRDRGRIASIACHRVGKWMSKLSSLKLKESTLLAIFFPSSSHCSLLLAELHWGKPLWFGMGSMQAETPILDNCSEMCLCGGAWGNKLTTNIITVLSSGRSFRQGGKEMERDTQGGRPGGWEGKKSLCRKRSFLDRCLHCIFVYFHGGFMLKITLQRCPLYYSALLWFQLVYCICLFFCYIYEAG